MNKVVSTNISVAYLMVLGLCLITACSQSDTPGNTESASLPGSASEETTSPPTNSTLAAREKLDASFRALEVAKHDITRDTFDPQAIVQKVGTDPAALIAWVRANTRWIPYQGALRGPVGVLMDQSGNSLDRSLLLAELLRVADYEVRLINGKLSPKDAKRLFPQLIAASSELAVSHKSLPSTIADHDLQRYQEQFNISGNDISKILADARATYLSMSAITAQRLAFQAPFLTRTIGLPITVDETTSLGESALSDHWWVEVHSSAGWRDADTLLSDAQRSSVEFAEVSIFPFDKPAGEIPLRDEYVHVITIRVIVEQWLAGRVTENVALEHSLRPAELLGVPIVFQNVPLKFGMQDLFVGDASPLQTLKDRIADQKEWLPQLQIGDLVIAQSSVDERGDLSSASDSSGPDAAGIADTLSGFDVFGGGDEAPQPDAHFIAEYIEYEIQVPGQQLRRIRREVFNLLPEQLRSMQDINDPAPNATRRLSRGLSLMGSIQVLPMVSRFSPEFATHQFVLDAFRNQDPIYQLHAALSQGDADGMCKELTRFAPTSERLYDLGIARFEWSLVGGEVYIGSPNILTYRKLVLVDGHGQLIEKQGFDIVANSVEKDPTSKKSAVTLRFNQGVADTNVEASLMGDRAVNAASELGTSATDESWTAIRSVNDSSLGGINVPAAVRARLVDSVYAGNVVVVPSRDMASTGSAHWTWWQIDAKTGETLGIDQHGWGGAPETAVLTPGKALHAAAQISGVSAGISFIACMAIKSVKGTLDPYPTLGSNTKKALADCGCTAWDVGVTTGGTIFGAAMGGAKGAGVGFAVASGIKKVVCA